MALPEHVKKLAMQAVADKKSTEWIRRYTTAHSGSGIFHERERGWTEQAKQEAVRAATQNEVTRNIKLVAVNTIAAPLQTPKRHAPPMADRIAQLYVLGKSVHEVHEEATKDGFGRDDDGR